MPRIVTEEQKKRMQEGRKKAQLERLTQIPDPIDKVDELASPEIIVSEQEIKKQRLEYLKNLPFGERYAPRFKKAWSKKGRGPAMKMKCLDCMGLQFAEIKRCTVVTCPLYEYR